MAKLKPWYQIVIPREDLRENRPLDASEFAVHLEQIKDGRAHQDYVVPERFFERTYLTRNLKAFGAQVLKRLSGIRVETSPVYNMSTQFGGGKTHALTMLYHLAGAGNRARDWRGVSDIVREAGLTEVPNAKVATFVGLEFDPLSGRGAPGEPRRKTPWGEIAWQLGGERTFRIVASRWRR